MGMKTTTPRLNRLVARYYPAVFHLAAKLSNSPAEALALTRLAFERAARQLPRFRSEDEINFLLLTSLSGAATPKAA
jgi:DNA-directed RNA polymerase specialized sigma24 family protein